MRIVRIDFWIMGKQEVEIDCCRSLLGYEIGMPNQVGRFPILDAMQAVRLWQQIRGREKLVRRKGLSRQLAALS